MTNDVWSSGCILWGYMKKDPMALDEALHSSFSPNVATWVVNQFNIPAQAFLHKIRSLTGEVYRGSYKALIKGVGVGELSKHGFQN